MNTDHVGREHRRRESESLFSWASAAAAASAANTPPNRASSDVPPSKASASSSQPPPASAPKPRSRWALANTIVLGVLAVVGGRFAWGARHGRVEDLAAVLLVAGLVGVWLLVRWMIRWARK